MRWLKRAFLVLELLPEHVLSRCCTCEVGVVWAYANVSVSRLELFLKYDTKRQTHFLAQALVYAPPFIFTYKAQPTLLQPIHIRRVHFVPVSMSLPYLASPAVQRPAFDQVLLPSSNTVGLSPRRIVPPICVRDISGIKMTVFRLGIKLTGNAVRARSRPFYHGKLEPEADTQEGYFGLACVLDGEHHTFGSALAEPARDENLAGADDGPPGVVIRRGTGFLHLWLEVLPTANGDHSERGTRV